MLFLILGIKKARLNTPENYREPETIGLYVVLLSIKDL
jgi:hypothetical protein